MWVALDLCIEEFLIVIDIKLLSRCSTFCTMELSKVLLLNVRLCEILDKNLVKVLITCSGVDYQGHDFKALVYEFMTKDNLDKWLHPISRTNEVTKKQMNLNLLQRLNIAIDVAKHWNIFIIIVIHQLLIATSSLAMFFLMMK